MSNLLIDAPLLSCPSPKHLPDSRFQEEFIKYLERLADLSILRECLPSTRFWRDEDLAMVLHEKECYPFRHSLAEALAACHNSDEFQLEDANILATALLERSLRLEDHTDVADVVVDGYEFIDDPVQDRAKIYGEHLCKLVSMALPVLGDGGNFSSNVLLASVATNGAAENITIKFELDLLEKIDGTYNDHPSSVNTFLKNYRGYNDLALSADVVDWWMSMTEQRAIDACMVAAGREKNDFSQEFMQKAPITFGGKFFDSARDLGFMHECSKVARLLRVIADLIIGRNLADSHRLRTGSGGNDPQRIRGDWKAWRHDIDYEYHLHYWKNGTLIEIANIVVHNDFSIES